MLLIINFMLPGLIHENVIQIYKIGILISTRNLGVFAYFISHTCTRCTGSSREMESVTYRGTSRCDQPTQYCLAGYINPERTGHVAGMEKSTSLLLILV